MKIGVLLLAAGFSRRFGSDKRLHLLDGQPLLIQTVQSILASGLPCRICIRSGDLEVGALLDQLDVEQILCDEASSGMGATLAEGIAASADWDGLLVALGDMAWIEPDTYRELASTIKPGSIVQPVCNGKPGNPVGFSREFYPQLAALERDRGGKAILQSHPDAVISVSVEDRRIFQDLDLPQDRVPSN